MRFKIILFNLIFSVVQLEAMRTYNPVSLKEMAAGALLKNNSLASINTLNISADIKEYIYQYHDLKKILDDCRLDVFAPTFDSGVFQTALLRVAEGKIDTYNKPFLIPWLIAKGAQPNSYYTELRRKYTMLHTAVACGNEAAVRMLLRCGAIFDLSVPIDVMHAPLCTAVFNRSLPIVRVLLQANANANVVGDGAGNTPLICAAHRGFEEIVVELFQYNIDVNIKNNHGMTALNAAARNNNITIMRLLLAHNADYKIRDDNGDTVFDIAARDERDDMLALLNAHRNTIRLAKRKLPKWTLAILKRDKYVN